MLCKAIEAGTDFLSAFYTFDLNFRNFNDWITFRSDILDGSLSRDLCDFTASRLNGVRDLNCRSFFILLSSLPLIIGTFVTESTAVLCFTEPGTTFRNTLTREHFATTLLRTKCVSLISHGQKTYPHYHFCQIFCNKQHCMKSHQCALSHGGGSLSPEGGSLSPKGGLLSHRGDSLCPKRSGQSSNRS